LNLYRYNTAPVAADVAGGWTDGGTLVRVALTAPLPPEWLECRFGSVVGLCTS
jgi:hypothetical protein